MKQEHIKLLLLGLFLNFVQVIMSQCNFYFDTIKELNAQNSVSLMKNEKNYLGFNYLEKITGKAWVTMDSSDYFNIQSLFQNENHQIMIRSNNANQSNKILPYKNEILFKLNFDLYTFQIYKFKENDNVSYFIIALFKDEYLDWRVNPIIKTENSKVRVNFLLENI